MWLTNKDTGGHFNTEWLEDDEHKKNRELVESEFIKAKQNADGKPHEIGDGQSKLTYMILKNRPDSIYIYDLMVNPESRNKGLGTKLIDQIKDLSNKYEMPIILNAYPTRTSKMTGEALISWYEKRGFKHLGANEMEYKPNKGKKTSGSLEDNLNPEDKRKYRDFQKRLNTLDNKSKAAPNDYKKLEKDISAFCNGKDRTPLAFSQLLDEVKKAQDSHNWERR